MKALRSESGYSLIETLVSTLLLGLVVTTFYTVMFSGARSSENTQEIARVSQQARAGFNRLIRDTREADSLSVVSENSYTVQIDFDNDGSYDNPNASGDYEDLTFSYHSASNTIKLNTYVLIDGVSKIGTSPIFSYTSNFLEYDWDADGVTTLDELEDADSHGVTSVSNGNEESFLSSVAFQFQVGDGDSAADFVSEAQLRNRR